MEPWPQGKLLPHAGVGYEIVLSLDVPVPQMGEQLPNTVQFFAAQLPVVAEPVIEVPLSSFLLGPVGIWSGDWVASAVSRITVDDVRVWPYSVSLLVKMSAFLSILHWPVAADDLGVGVFLLLSYSFCMSFGLVNGFLLRGAVPKRLRAGRPISVSVVPFGPGNGPEDSSPQGGKHGAL